MTKYTKGQTIYMATNKFDEARNALVHYVKPVVVVSCGAKVMKYEGAGSIGYSVSLDAGKANFFHDNFADAEKYAQGQAANPSRPGIYELVAA